MLLAGDHFGTIFHLRRFSVLVLSQFSVFTELNCSHFTCFQAFRVCQTDPTKPVKQKLNYSKLSNHGTRFYFNLHVSWLNLFLLDAGLLPDLSRHLLPFLRVEVGTDDDGVGCQTYRAHYGSNKPSVLPASQNIPISAHSERFLLPSLASSAIFFAFSAELFIKI